MGNPSTSPNPNRKVEIALSYHEETKHSSVSIKTKPHYLDFSNQPSLYKVYPKLEPIPLPKDFPSPDEMAPDAIRDPGMKGGMKELDSSLLAQVLYYSCGITRRIRFTWGEFPFRAAPSAGALYPVEAYVVCKDIHGLDAGVYHFHPEEFSLRQLREGDFSETMTRFSSESSAIAFAPVTLVFTAIFWKSAWKYLARSYRHCYWDSGTILANVLAVAASSKVPCKLVTGFVDEEVNRVLDIDGKKEGSLCLLALGRSQGPPGSSPPIEVLGHEVAPISKYELEYPEITSVHGASSLTSLEEVEKWVHLGENCPPSTQSLGGEVYPLEFMKDLSAIPSIGEVIMRRGSTRVFSRESISFEGMSTVLENSTKGFPCDFLHDQRQNLIDTYMIINAVHGLPPGAYFFSPKESKIQLLKKGSLRAVAGYLCLEQALAYDASAVLFYMSELEKVLKFYGNRGYRLAQLEAGILGGKAYLSSYALGMGATGLTFYDDEVTEFFSPHAERKSAMFVVAVGVPSKRKGNDR